MKILLMGNPNVGKSVVFSRLTGVNVTVSNYPGTTVELAKGWTQYNGERVEVIDAPGVYSLDASSKSEEVAVDMLKECDLIINVVDSTKLERNLNLTLQLIETGLPICVALNIWDETKHKGIQIDVGKLEKLLGVPVVCTAAIAGMGIKDLFFRLREAAPREAVKRTQHERWDEIGKIISSAQSLFHHHHTLMEALEEASVRPVSGILIATTILFASFKIIRFIAEGLINFIFEPFFNKFYMILVAKLSLFLGEGGLLHDILIGRLI